MEIRIIALLILLPLFGSAQDLEIIFTESNALFNCEDCSGEYKENLISQLNPDDYEKAYWESSWLIVKNFTKNEDDFFIELAFAIDYAEGCERTASKRISWPAGPQHE